MNSKFCAKGGYAVVASLVVLVVAGRAQGTPTLQAGPEPKAPPPAPPIQVVPKDSIPPISTPTKSGFGSTLYSIGQPTDEEQQYLEYINRSRANPTAEGVRLANTTDPNVVSAYTYFGVDLALMQNEFATNPAVPPLALNAKLIDAARWHSGDMFTNMYQAHGQTNGGVVRDPGQRMNFKGYTWNTWGENIYAYAENVFYGHAGLNVDWGPGVGGMQNPPGHRNSIHNGNFREVGIGVFNGVNGSVGPQLVTQDFATQPGATPLITGVAYYDFNTNGFYDLGEGIGGVTVAVNNSTYYALTASSGGFAVPVTTNGNYTVVFSGPGFASNTVTVTISTLKNAKRDFIPVYSPPVIAGPNPATVNQSNVYTFTAVGGATNYEWFQTQISPYIAVEGAENGLANVTVVSSPGYLVQDGSVAASGFYSFHLAQPDGANQSLTLNAKVLLSSNSQLTFSKRLGWATSSQIAKAQISTDGGASWQDIWSQPGNSTSGDSAFSAVTVSLSPYAGQTAQIRFAYQHPSLGYYPQTDPGVGFYVDDISILNAEELGSQTISMVGVGTSFSFSPTSTNEYLLAVRGLLPGRTLPWGPTVRVSVAAAAPPPVVQLAGVPVIVGNQIQLDFGISNYRSGMTFQLWQASDPAGPWSLDATATISTIVSNTKLRATTTIGAASRMFYRIKGLY